jgi:D-sedoheptulose 7-phosphate isomerase
MKRKVILDDLIYRYPMLEACRVEIVAAYEMFEASFNDGGKLLICGNGGSAADADHIVGELMKSFRAPRPLSDEVKTALLTQGDSLDMSDDGLQLSEKLTGGLPAINLSAHSSLLTAMINDVGAEYAYSQQVMALGSKGDVLLGISTSGSAKNVCFAALTAKALGLSTICLTGSGGGKLSEVCDRSIRVPETETFKIQELHLPVYHTLCLMLEARFFG